MQKIREIEEIQEEKSKIVQEEKPKIVQGEKFNTVQKEPIIKTKTSRFRL